MSAPDLEAYFRAIDECNDIYLENGGVVEKTPLEPAPLLGEKLGCEIFLKREDLQPIRSFKLRGAYNKICKLVQSKHTTQVVTASAGNHAQGVALSCGKIGIDSYIVMPTTTPSIKVRAVERLGGNVILYGDNFEEACQHAYHLEAEQKIDFIHPFDDRDVIVGQGTVGKEICSQYRAIHQHGHINAVFVPVGGGGLAAGLGVYLKRAHPQAKIIAVEPSDSATMKMAIDKGTPSPLDVVGAFADGVAVRKAGTETFRLARRVLDDCILVSTDEICSAIKEHFLETRAILEPAGALSLAGLIQYCRTHRVSGKSLVTISSGANINFDRLQYIAERCEIGEQTETLLAVSIPERPGSFLEFCQALGDYEITEFNYRMKNSKDAHIFVGIKLGGTASSKQVVIRKLKACRLPTVDMSDNEMAKIHVRHLVGGRFSSADSVDERLFSFCFPERKGALLQFLVEFQRHNRQWNISLFHYRNHGAAYGYVLVGVQVPEQDEAEFKIFLDALGFKKTEETDNPAYRLFLR